jgi:transcriptional regulator with XRE-family HTH domain
MKYHEKISLLLKIRAISMRDFAAGIQASIPSAQALKDGKTRNPHPATKKKLAKFFSLTVEQLFDDDIHLPQLPAPAAIHDNPEPRYSFSQYMDMHRISARQVAEDVGVPEADVLMWKRGECMPPPRLKWKVEERLSGRPAGYFWPFTTEDLIAKLREQNAELRAALKKAEQTQARLSGMLDGMRENLKWFREQGFPASSAGTPVQDFIPGATDT